MKTWAMALLLTAGSFLLGGCATLTVTSDVTAFHATPFHLQEKTYSFLHTPEQENNLEYRNYEDLVRAELLRLGFVETPPTARPKLKASISYSISVRDVRVIEPVVINNYGPSPFWPGPYWRGYYGPFYDPFWYSPPLVETRDTSYQIFTRQFHFILARTEDGDHVYEMTVKSEGQESSLAAVIPYMVHSAFMEFPAPDGVPRRIEVKVSK